MDHSFKPAGAPAARVSTEDLPGPAEVPDPLVAARKRRAELAATLSETEQAVAAPAPGRVESWAGRVRSAVERLSLDVRLHVELTEGDDGLYQDVLTQAPRLSSMIVKLEGEHVRMVSAVEDVLRLLGSTPGGDDWVAEVRERVTSLLVLFSRHRQRGADLVYEAYETDIGGGG